MKTVLFMLPMVTALSLLGGGLLLMPSAAEANHGGKSDVCHHTSSETNPVVLINISDHAVAQHLALHGGTGPDEVDGEECEKGGGPPD